MVQNVLCFMLVLLLPMLPILNCFVGGGGVDLCLSDVVVQVMSVLLFYLVVVVVSFCGGGGGGGLSDFCFV